MTEQNLFVELLKIGKRWGFIDNLNVTLRIGGRIRKVSIFRDIGAHEKLAEKCKDEKWITSCARYALMKLLTGEEWRREPDNSFVTGKRFGIAELLEDC